MSRFLTSMALGLITLAPMASTVVGADSHPRTYHDKARNEDHEWNSQEDKAYRIWLKENHRKYRDFAKLKEEERQTYWGWRHDHSDALLKIDIH